MKFRIIIVLNALSLIGIGFAFGVAWGKNHADHIKLGKGDGLTWTVRRN